MNDPRGLRASDDCRSLDYENVYARFIWGFGVLFVGVEVVYFLSLQSFSFFKPGIDVTGSAIGRDFINTWMGGLSAFSGGPGAWFDYTTYNAALKEIVGRPDFPLHYWSYPPHIVLFVWPLGLLPYLPAYVLWCIVGLALYLLAAWSGGVVRRLMLFVAVAPGVGVNIFFGQNGFLTAALLIGGLASLDRRPIVSGLLLGLLTIKPQFGFLLPLMLVMTGRWRVIAAALATVLALAVVTSMWFGTEVWFDYFRKVMPQQHILLVDAGRTGWPMVASTFVNAQFAGLSAEAAWVVQAISSCSAVALVVWTFWRRRDPVLSNALLVTATFLFSPWMLNYDMVVFGWIVALLRLRADNTPIDHGLLLAMWLLPLIMMPLALAHLPTALLVLAAFAGRLVWRLGRDAARQNVAADLSAAQLARPSGAGATARDF